jgi:hypothetical protein
MVPPTNNGAEWCERAPGGEVALGVAPPARARQAVGGGELSTGTVQGRAWMVPPTNNGAEEPTPPLALLVV